MTAFHCPCDQIDLLSGLLWKLEPDIPFTDDTTAEEVAAMTAAPTRQGPIVKLALLISVTRPLTVQVTRTRACVVADPVTVQL